VSLEENKAKVRRVIEAINRQDLDLLDDLVARDYVDHTHQLSPESVKRFMAVIFEAFPDWHETVEDIIAEGDKVWVRVKATGTHKGRFRGLAPTGKKVTAAGVSIYRLVGGKFAEGWAVDDWMDCYKQIGVIDYKGFPDEVK
jgi:predicted ester cyclase